MTAQISKVIDNARVGLSKSLMTTPCERKGFYSETVRDSAGRRLSFPLPERVTFGTAVDEAVTYILWHDRRGEAWTAAEAIDIGLTAAQKQRGWPLVSDPEVFGIQLTNAINLYLRPHDVPVEGERGKTRTEDNGLARIQSLYAEGLLLQGNDGESLRAGDVIGTPDYKTGRRVGDLKTWGRNDGDKKFWRSPEMGLYAYLYTAENGALPETVFYQAYIRVNKPYWLWLEIPATSALVELGRQTADHWRGLLEIGRPELFPFDTTFCGDCPFRDAMPEVGHAGCAVGQTVPREEIAA